MDPASCQVIDITRKQEETRQAEEKTKQEGYRAQQAQADIERQRVAFEEQRKLNAQAAQNKAQMLRYEDELARKRMGAEHEAQRQRNQELVKVRGRLVFVGYRLGGRIVWLVFLLTFREKDFRKRKRFPLFLYRASLYEASFCVFNSDDVAQGFLWSYFGTCPVFSPVAYCQHQLGNLVSGDLMDCSDGCRCKRSPLSGRRP